MTGRSSGLKMASDKCATIHVAYCLAFHGTMYDLVVQSCGQPTGRESILFTEWSFNRDFYVVPATALVALCFVLVSNPADGSVLVVKDESLWASNFYDATQTVYA